jgi:N6-L-threonylcarbamoyladenine synthase
MKTIILGIESSCDDTSAAVLCGTRLLSNVIAAQSVHEQYGGVVPELASRAHMQNISWVVDSALCKAGIAIDDIDAIAFTRGPGLLGALLVGTSFAKGIALALDVPLVDVNHLQGHVLAHFVDERDESLPHPDFPFLCQLVSGGHTQILRVDAPLRHVILGQTIDDAAGEAFDKCAKVMGLPYPGGKAIDDLAKRGDSQRFRFAMPKVADLNYSFSGLKTSFLYILQDMVKENPDFIIQNINDLCASLQRTIIDILLQKLYLAVEQTGIRVVALSGGVSANSGLRNALKNKELEYGWDVFLPPLKYTTDNAAMIAIAGYYKFIAGETCGLDAVPSARM